ncbi:MAG: hypothetical protein OER56_09415 [Hyphomicrobiales bacterium]|nr:hypothetical protein [Hyphomicrobiales bacterium]
MSWRQIKIGPLLVFVGLTPLTQVGGLVYLIARWISVALSRRFGFGRARSWLTTTIGFCTFYVAVSVLVLPPVATALAGRHYRAPRLPAKVLCPLPA